MDKLSVYLEARKFSGTLVELHPLKLDRWHRGLVDLPDAIYMQYGCPELYEQIGQAIEGIKVMVEMLGEKNLPLDPQEIARRRIGKFAWHIGSPSQATGTLRCILLWSQEKTSWTLTCNAAPDTIKTVNSFLEGFELGKKWVAELEQSSKDEG